ncbi:DoxX family protein [Leucobacter massiliensis]|uniref:DoxX family protein n=1 Tax=Leucobacter massiliensis TaxID=1686285 RepID=A0A2S9QR36_9MICO|nr:DoxX family protein [Leucobacter massiliensis]PRI12054.1 DoxX family protein [Leucobacter massiliensis]
MLIAFWIVGGLLALAFLAAGLMKIARPKEALAASGMAWAADFSSTSVKWIGIAEVLGALGIVLPPLTGIAPVLSPIAAIALAVLMVGAIVVHARRKEPFAPALVLAIVSIVVAILGFVAVA